MQNYTNLDLSLALEAAGFPKPEQPRFGDIFWNTVKAMPCVFLFNRGQDFCIARPGGAVSVQRNWSNYVYAPSAAEILLHLGVNYSLSRDIMGNLKEVWLLLQDTEDGFRYHHGEVSGDAQTLLAKTWLNKDKLPGEQ